MADEYDVFGTWKLECFERKLSDWRSLEHPPDDLYSQVEAWYPSLGWAPRTSAALLPDEENLWFVWVPGCYLLDKECGRYGVQCHFWVVELGHRVVCDLFGMAKERY